MNAKIKKCVLFKPYCCCFIILKSTWQHWNLHVPLKSRWWETFNKGRLQPSSSARHLATEPNTKFFKCHVSIEFAFERYWHTVSFSSIHRGYLESNNCIVWISLCSMNSSNGLIYSRWMMYLVTECKIIHICYPWLTFFLFLLSKKKKIDYWLHVFTNLNI